MTISAWAAQIATVFFFSACFAAATTDVLSYRIPNSTVGMMTALYLPFAMAAGLDPTLIGLSFAAAACVFAGGTAIFMGGGLGGGDVKFATVIALWIGPSALLSFLFLSAVTGAAFALAILVVRYFPMPTAVPAWLRDRIDVTGRKGIPYGVALATGAIMVLPDTNWIAF